MAQPSIVTLDQAKAHLRVDLESIDEDDDIELKLAAATQLAIAYLDRDVYATEQDLQQAQQDGTAGDLPLVATDLVRAAILLILGDLYINREDVVTGQAQQLPTGARACLRPLRRWGA